MPLSNDTTQFTSCCAAKGYERHLCGVALVAEVLQTQVCLVVEDDCVKEVQQALELPRLQHVLHRARHHCLHAIQREM